MTAKPDDCATVGEMLGVYALDALEPDEAAFVEAHLHSCPRCSQEYYQHVETVGLLASAGGPAPEGIWERISAAIAGDGGPDQIPRSPLLLGSTRWRRRSRWQVSARAAAAAAAVAAAVMIGVQTARVDHLDWQVKQLNSAAQQTGGFQGLAEALVDPTAKHLVLTSTAPGAKPLGQLIILPSGSAYLVGSRLAPLPNGSTYQLWSVVAGRAVSVGLLGDHPNTVAFSVDASVPTKAYLVTVEPAGGVVAPTTAPVAKASV